MEREGRIGVDPTRCQGHGRCAALAPDLFELDELGSARVRADGVVPAARRAAAERAIANCPEHALRWSAGGSP